MGGQKKKPLSRMEKQKREKAEAKKEKPIKKTLRISIIPQELLNKMLTDIKKSKYVTPTMLAQRYEIKVSSAKKILRKLENDRVVEPRVKTARLTVYVPVKT